jgi:uncharacterized membrane protein
MDLARRTHRRLLMAVGVIVVLTLAGMVALWPSADELPPVDDRDTQTFDGTIAAIEYYQGESNEYVGGDGSAALIDIELTSGPDAGQVVQIDTPLEGYPDFAVGDEVKLTSSEVDGELAYFIVDFERTSALVWLLALFIAAVLAVGRWHGLRSLIGLALSLVVVTKFIVPGILAGQSPFAVALVGSLAVMLVSLYLAHGVNEMTTTAVVGTATALGITIGLALVFIDAGQLTGYSSEEANLVRFSVEGLDLKGLVLAGLIIAALGVLDDVTVSQASTVFALHEADRTQPWRTLFGRAMTVGRDHIASTVNTLFLAYAGASLALLMVFSTGGLPVAEIVNAEVFAEEVIKTVVGSLAIVAAVPLTTALAATLAVRRPLDAPPIRGHVHAHGGADAMAMATDVTAHPHGEPAVEAAADDDLSDEERAYRSWVNYLRDERVERDD